MSARNRTWRTGASRTAPHANPALSLKTGGRPLDSATRAYMEPRFGHDFSGVRVHTDAQAARASGAHALTAGEHIAFAPGHYLPDTPAGRGLVAHELAHVVQQRHGRGDPNRVSAPGDRDESAAQQAIHDVAQARIPRLGAAHAGVQRQSAGDAPTPLLPVRPSLFPSAAIASQQSASELVLESFLNRMWDAQSSREQPLRLSANVLDGLHLILGMDAPVSPYATFETASELIARLRPLLKSGAPDLNAPAALDKLVAGEKPLAHGGTALAGTPAAPIFPGPAPGPAPIPDPRKPPPHGDNYDEAAMKALGAAFETFRKTRLGRELEKAVKEYVFSKDGIPLVIWVTTVGATFLAANDPKLPSVPDIPVGHGITLKFDVSAKGSELPLLLRDLVHDRAEPPGTPERKVAVSATFTFEALGELAAAVGHFFAEAATWIGKGIVRAGTVIGRGASAFAKALAKVPPELLFGAAGAALGAGIGALAGGGVGALIGAGVGLAAGIGAGVIKRYLGKEQT
ncbi:DUF4157 domain-containing protein [Paraburkholderia sp. J7]|uniref:eCIS core domain-containing protein n=1 Tax=Paraburkholderia sp. J7 TaxID=2805438 RepID=UPI002AB607CF|nr:DUF4157 domain-containing protein [Paraburkholderia sp. J7]